MMHFVPVSFVNDLVKAMCAAALARWEGRSLGRALYWANAFDNAERDATDSGEGMFLLNPYFPHDTTPREVHITPAMWGADIEQG